MNAEKLYKYRYWIGGGIAFAIILFVLSSARKNKKGGSTKYSRGIIIGDSQTPYIAKRTTKASLLGTNGSEQNLWKGGMGLAWLKNAVDKYPVTEDMGHVVINIGTNGGFNPKDDVEGLISSLKAKFPNARLYTVQGSWGWGGNANVSTDKVNKYYQRFTKGTTVINPPIGVVKDPHGHLPVYVEIGKSIDKAIG